MSKNKLMDFTEINKYIDSFYEEKLSEYDLKYYITQYTEKENISAETLSTLFLKDCATNRNNETLEGALLVVFIFNIRNKEVVGLCQSLLLEDWHERHEDIISVLEEARNKESIAYLLKAFQMKLKYMQYNNHYSFHKKLLWAVYKLSGSQYKNELLKLTEHISPKLKPEWRQFIGDKMGKIKS
ncbi:hypothetical protein CAPN004_04760 [Capnocytophaga cynodegmi]|uniref:hypothetical protein n=1 Tax=Capnocytophaga cynodegmi TaxID=28189 RepID=UPI001ACC8E7C|nr:hypothetical protein [Capnocytophaga cynodegmi]GIM51446.1 hypothetical protein CAPN004_04760 [Capnocytophaga cynodegmi]